jgi:hypothetical protein
MRIFHDSCPFCNNNWASLGNQKLPQSFSSSKIIQLRTGKCAQECTKTWRANINTMRAKSRAPSAQTPAWHPRSFHCTCARPLATIRMRPSDTMCAQEEGFVSFSQRQVDAMDRGATRRTSSTLWWDAAVIVVYSYDKAMTVNMTQKPRSLTHSQD